MARPRFPFSARALLAAWVYYAREGRRVHAYGWRHTPRGLVLRSDGTPAPSYRDVCRHLRRLALVDRRGVDPATVRRALRRIGGAL